MCLLCYLPPQAEIKTEALENSCANNPDGFGWSLRKTSGEIVTFRSMSADRTISEFIKARALEPESHALFHARLATAGLLAVENCHPFTVPKSEVVLAHNGHLPVALGLLEKRSDTRVFAEDLFPQRLEALDNPRRFAKLEKWAKGSKLVILSNDKRLRQPAYLVNESAGHWLDGVWFSNYGYEDYRSTIGAYSYPYGSVDDCFCPACESVIEDDSSFWESGVCPDCFTCIDCGGAAGWSCLCYGASTANSFGYYYSEGGSRYGSRAINSAQG